MAILRSNPAVSVVLPTYNRRTLIERSLQTVLSQSYQDLELIVVDDGSSDGTWDVVQDIDDPRIRPVRNVVNEGQAAARNVGILLARGRFIAFQDSDDEWLPGKLERHMAVFAGDVSGEIGVVYSDMYLKHHSGICEYHSSPQIVPGQLVNPKTRFYQSYGLGIQSTVMRRECLGPGYLFDVRLRCFEDLELFTRQSRRFGFYHLREPLVNYNQTGGATTDMLQAYLARRLLLRLYYRDLWKSDRLFLVMEWGKVVWGLWRMRRTERPPAA